MLVGCLFVTLRQKNKKRERERKKLDFMHPPIREIGNPSSNLERFQAKSSKESMLKVVQLATT